MAAGDHHRPVDTKQDAGKVYHRGYRQADVHHPAARGHQPTHQVIPKALRANPAIPAHYHLVAAVLPDMGTERPAQ